LAPISARFISAIQDRSRPHSSKRKCELLSFRKSLLAGVGSRGVLVCENEMRGVGVRGGFRALLMPSISLAVIWSPARLIIVVSLASETYLNRDNWRTQRDGARLSRTAPERPLYDIYSQYWPKYALCSRCYPSYESPRVRCDKSSLLARLGIGR
jgi:hypothetical protein